MERWEIGDSIKLYGIESWGAGYFSINKEGNLIVRPTGEASLTVDLREIVDTLASKKVSFPILLRFTQILETQVERLNECFRRAIAEYSYEGKYMGVFPVKVNQNRDVVEELQRAGRKYDLGIEVGSKAELLAALATKGNPRSLLICNGYKDNAFIDMALLASKMDRNIIIIAERISELKRIISYSKEIGLSPGVGLRARLYSKGSGRWESSSGEGSKFGLSASELLECVRLLSESNMLGSLRMVHFHIGSQITEIDRIQGAVKEAGRVYAKLKRIGGGLEYLNIGGGLGIDYDGSRTSFDSSANYSMQEYANDVVYTIGDVCKNEDIPSPIIVSESGRALSAYHSLLVADVRGKASFNYKSDNLEPPEGASHVVKEFYDIWKNMNAKNYREYYHDAIQQKEELFTLFSLGFLSLEDRALGEMLFQDICRKAESYARQFNHIADEFISLRKQLSSKYIVNFSVFQSLPDNWAIDHLFPILPIQRLGEKPTVYVTLVDLTCDSDGKIDRFIDIRDVKEMLELHHLDDRPYYLGFFLLGAYQDAMGDFHNLFGGVNEVIVVVDSSGDWHIKKIVPGDSLADVLRYVKYNRQDLENSFKTIVDKRISEGLAAPNDADLIKCEYVKMMDRLTYLES